MVLVGHTLSAEADGSGCENAQTPPQQHPNLSSASNYERYDRRVQLQDPVDQSQRPGLSKLRELSNCYTVLLREASATPGLGHKKPGRTKEKKSRLSFDGPSTP